MPSPHPVDTSGKQGRQQNQQQKGQAQKLKTVENGNDTLAGIGVRWHYAEMSTDQSSHENVSTYFSRFVSEEQLNKERHISGSPGTEGRSQTEVVEIDGGASLIVVSYSF